MAERVTVELVVLLGVTYSVIRCYNPPRIMVGVAQWQSVALWMRMLRVRNPSPTLHLVASPVDWRGYGLSIRLQRT